MNQNQQQQQNILRTRGNNNANIVIGRKELRNLSITTTFANEPLDTVLQIIATTFQLKIINKEVQIILQ